MKIKSKYSCMLLSILLSSCGNDVPSKSEVEDLIINEGISAEAQQIKTVLYEQFLYTAKVVNKNIINKKVAEKDPYDVRHLIPRWYNPPVQDKVILSKLSEAKTKIDNIELNKKNLRKTVANFINIETADCHLKKGFDRFYDCSINVMTNYKNNNALKSFNITFHRIDDGTLKEVSTPYFYISDGMNVFSTLAGRNIINSLIEIPEGNKYLDLDSSDNYYIENKEPYANLLNDIKNIHSTE